MSYVLFESCKVVAGYKRAMILDIQRRTYYFIPVEYCTLINPDGVLTWSSSISKENYDDFLEFLVSEELVFDCPPGLVKNFVPGRTIEWDCPSRISNAIIELASIRNDNYCPLLNDILQQLDALSCRHIEVRSVETTDRDSLEKLIGILTTCSPAAYALSISISPDEADAIVDLLQSEAGVYRTNIFGWSENKTIVFNENNHGNIFFTTHIYTQTLCGIVNQDYFTINIDFFEESRRHNTCLNRKIAIDAAGNIRNCLGMTKIYGNILDTRLADVAGSGEFQQLWSVSKDRITVCSDCEFRHVCTDCRAYLENPEDILSKPLKCGYDPYTNTWGDWSTNPLKQEAIAYYEMNTVLI